MLEKVVTLACILFGLLCAVSIESWLRRHHGNKQLASDVYTATLEKYSEFWSAQIIPASAIIVIVGLLYYFGIGADISSLIAYVAGSISCLLPVFIGSRSFASGAISSSSLLYDGELKGGLRSAFRGGAVMGLVLMTFGSAIISILLFVFKQDRFIDVAEGFVLGSALSGCVIGLFGAILTSAHKLSETNDLNIDYTGAFVAVGADYAVSFTLAICSVVLLAEVGVDTSGVSSTFTVSAAAKYPLMIASTGVVASVIGIFAYRVVIDKHSDLGLTAGSLIAAVISFAASLYFSIEILGTRSYAYCIGFGMLAQFLSAEFCKFFSMGSDIFRRNLPKTKDEDIDIPMLGSLSTGLISAIVPGVFIGTAVILSYNIAMQYGVALAALGVNSIAAVNAAIRAFAPVLSASCSFAESFDGTSDDNVISFGFLRRISSKSKAAGRAYSSVSASLTLMSLIMAVTYRSEKEILNITHPLVFGGMIFGALVTLLLLGVLIRAILKSTVSMTDYAGEGADEFRNISSVRGLFLLEIPAMISPVAIGFTMGIDCLIGFMGATIITGMCLVLAFNNTGRYYDRIASDAFGSVIKLMIAVTIACVPAFIQYGGIFF